MWGDDAITGRLSRAYTFAPQESKNSNILRRRILMHEVLFCSKVINVMVKSAAHLYHGSYHIEPRVCDLF
jgi:hypothetical protein